jgi:DNA-binding NarL/FixJ family response regulator
VFHLLAQGASNREIAETLTISENTVKTHVRNILEKLELRNRGEVAAFARRTSSAP